MSRPATTLQAQAQQHANEKHARRLAEIQAMAPMLAQLDKLMPALTERGLFLGADDFWLTSMLQGDTHAFRRIKVLRINTRGLCTVGLAKRWYTALVDLGFKLVQVDSREAYPCATLRLKHLLVNIDIDPADAPMLRQALQAATERDTAVPA